MSNNEILDKCFVFGSSEDVIEKIEKYIKVSNCRYFLLNPEIMSSSKSFLKDFSENVLPHFK